MIPQGLSGQGRRRENLLSPSGFEFRSTQLLAIRWTEYANPASSHRCSNFICLCIQRVVWSITRIWCMFHRASLYIRRAENQLDATEWFIALIICSTYLGHLYVHHQKLETILVLLRHMVCYALVAGQQAVRESARAASLIACCPAPDRRPPATKALHTICSNITSIVSSSWWWA